MCLKEIRKKIDPGLAALDPKVLPAAIKIRIAPAMSAKPTAPFWGGEMHHDLDETQKKMIGCMKDWQIPIAARAKMKQFADEMTAREVVQMYTGPTSHEELPNPSFCAEHAAETPNAYTDGSMLNPKGLHWAVGGVGVWWPARTKEPTEDEVAYAHCDNKDGGLMLWNIFNTLKNSSTRCEIGATLLGMLPPWAVNLGVDNSATVGNYDKDRCTI